PPTVAASARVWDLPGGLTHVPRPAAEADIEALGEGRSIAHRSLVFDELFFLQLGLALRRSAVVAEAGMAFAPSRRLADALRGRLGFTPTGAQERAVVEIARDLGAPHPMRRLLQGDVGSGKTLVAVMAALGVLEAGHQVALMAPTELLAEQHHATVGPWLRDLGIDVGLVTGSMKGAARRAVLAGLASGEIPFAVGTHALIQEAVAFAPPGLAIVDRPHPLRGLQP